MESEIIKQTFKLGNSAGVLLPIDWKDKKVKIQLIDKSITQDILEILEEKDLLKNVIGIYLAGSYARDEASPESDVDVLVISDKVDKQIKMRGYEIIFVSREKFEKNFLNSLYLISLANEAKTIINDDYILKYKGLVPKIKIKKHIEEIKSIIKINEEFIKLDEEMKNKVPDDTIYSIILRLRELYIMECLKNNKKPHNKELIDLIKKIATIESYNSYLRVKNDLKSKEVVSVNEAKGLIDYIKSKIIILEGLEHGKKK